MEMRNSIGPIKRLPEESHIGRALTAAELSGLLKLAESRPEWATLRCAVTLAVNTTMRSMELKNLHWRDVDFFDRIVTIRRSKTEVELRVIPMNEDAQFAMLGLLKQAQKAGADAPEHFVFPACENGTIDPLKPQKSWRTAWRSLARGIHCLACGEFQSAETICHNEACTADISKVTCSTAGLRLHDLRHTAIVILAEGNANEQTVMAIAGHMSRKMLEHSRIRMDAKQPRHSCPDGAQGPASEHAYFKEDCDGLRHKPRHKRRFARNYKLVSYTKDWWAWVDSNHRPHPYQGCALTT